MLKMQWMQMNAWWQECKKCLLITILQLSKKLALLHMPSLDSMVVSYFYSYYLRFLYLTYFAIFYFLTWELLDKIVLKFEYFSDIFSIFFPTWLDMDSGRANIGPTWWWPCNTLPTRGGPHSPIFENNATH